MAAASLGPRIAIFIIVDGKEFLGAARTGWISPDKRWAYQRFGVLSQGTPSLNFTIHPVKKKVCYDYMSEKIRGLIASP